jgi:V8-like Glu-specific endopeptidase
VDWLTPERFKMNASICPGDSGGPVHARGSPEVVGVVSLSAMDADDRTRNTSIIVRVDAYRGLIDRARHIADGAPSSELPPVTCAP